MTLTFKEYFKSFIILLNPISLTDEINYVIMLGNITTVYNTKFRFILGYLYLNIFAVLLVIQLFFTFQIHICLLPFNEF